jgi:hypothetical protein
MEPTKAGRRALPEAWKSCAVPEEYLAEGQPDNFSKLIFFPLTFSASHKKYAMVP